MDDTVVIALFRHGLTEENKRKAYLGWNDSPLCTESANLSTRSRYDLYYSSDLPRCIESGNILFPNNDLILLPHLREMNFGQWEGKTYEDLKELPLYQQWLSNPTSYCPPGGESFEEFTHRIQNGWGKIAGKILSENIERCAIITHGGIIRYLLSKYAPMKNDFWYWQVPHEQGYELIFEREALRRGDTCTLLREVPLTVKEHG
jgi:alpha-ribazole phosphatase